MHIPKQVRLAPPQKSFLGLCGTMRGPYSGGDKGALQKVFPDAFATLSYIAQVTEQAGKGSSRPARPHRCEVSGSIPPWTVDRLCCCLQASSSSGFLVSLRPWSSDWLDNCCKHLYFFHWLVPDCRLNSCRHGAGSSVTHTCDLQVTQCRIGLA